MRLTIRITNYNKGIKNRAIIATLKNDLLRKGLLIFSVLLKKIPKLKEIFPKYIVPNSDGIIINILNQKIEIFNKNIELIKENEGMKFTVKIDNIDLDTLIDQLADNNFADDDLVRELIKTANRTLEGDEKITLVQQILALANKNRLIDALLKTAADNNETIGNIVTPLKLEIGDISLEV